LLSKIFSFVRPSVDDAYLVNGSLVLSRDIFFYLEALSKSVLILIKIDPWFLAIALLEENFTA